jgi:hypothetical protein
MTYTLNFSVGECHTHIFIYYGIIVGHFHINYSGILEKKNIKHVQQRQLILGAPFGHSILSRS